MDVLLLYRIKLNLKYLEAVELRCVLFKTESFRYFLRWQRWTDFKTVSLHKVGAGSLCRVTGF
jgi:hypothetical protein